MYSYRSTLGPVELAFTDRHGGVSGVPFASLNLAVSGGDDPVALGVNHERLIADFAGDRIVEVADVSQVHGCDVVDATDRLARGSRPPADALVSDQADVVLLVRAADCVPVLLADPHARVIGAAHAGRGGVQVGILTATVARMRELGAEDVTAWIGPHVCGACYEVPPEMRDEVDAAVPGTAATTAWGTPSLDLGVGARTQLLAAGVRSIHAVERCTVEDPDLFSYRREGPRSGRLAGLVVLSSPDEPPRRSSVPPLRSSTEQRRGDPR